MVKLRYLETTFVVPLATMIDDTNTFHLWCFRDRIFECTWLVKTQILHSMCRPFLCLSVRTINKATKAYLSAGLVDKKGRSEFESSCAEPVEFDGQTNGWNERPLVAVDEIICSQKQIRRNDDSVLISLVLSLPAEA